MLHFRLAACKGQKTIALESFLAGATLATASVLALLLSAHAGVPTETVIGAAGIGGTVGMGVLQVVRRHWHRAAQEPLRRTR